MTRLHQLIREGELIRNVRLAKAVVTTSEWEPVEPVDVRAEARARLLVPARRLFVWPSHRPGQARMTRDAASVSRLGTKGYGQEADLPEVPAVDAPAVRPSVPLQEEVAAAASCCPTCVHEFKEGDRYIEDTSSGFLGLDAEPTVDGLMADLFGGAGGPRRRDRGGDQVMAVDRPSEEEMLRGLD